MADQPIQLVPHPPPPPRGVFALWSALDPAVKVVLQLLALVSAIAGCVQVYNSVVTDIELAVVRTAQAKVDQAQEVEIEGLDDDQDLFWQTQVRLTTDVDWLKQEMTGVRQDLRRLDRGLPLPPLPTPVQTSAPIPTRTP